MRFFAIVFAVGSLTCAHPAFASKRCAQQLKHLNVMGVRINLATKPNPVQIEINLDSPPASFSDPADGSFGNLAGHHDIVGVAVDRNFNNPMQNGPRYNNFEAAVARWLGGPDAPEALCGFNGFTRPISNSFSIYATTVVAKDGFGNEIRMLYDRDKGEMTIRNISDSNGRPFPSRYEKSGFATDFLYDHSAAVAYAGLLENAGLRVPYTGSTKLSSRAKWRISCSPQAGGHLACQLHGE